MNENELSYKIIGAAIEVHNVLGPGLLESAYKECLYYKIAKIGLQVQKEKPMPLIFEEVKLDCGYRIDLFVENKLVVEIKSVEALNDIFNDINAVTSEQLQGLAQEVFDESQFSTLTFVPEK